MTILSVQYCIVLRASVSDIGKDPQTLLDEDDDMSPEDEAVGIAIPDGFRPQESRPATLDGSVVKRGVLVRLSMEWFGGLITRKSQERTKDLYDYRVHLEEDQSVRSLKLPLGAYSTESSAAGGAWVLLQPNEEEQREGAAVAGGEQNSQLGGSAAGGNPAVCSSRGRTLAPNVRNVDHVL